MRAKIFLFPLLLCIIPLALAVLGWWTDRLLGRGSHKQLARTPSASAEANCRWPWTARRLGTLPEIVAHRWIGPDLCRIYWEPMPASLDLVRDDINGLSPASDRKMSMRLRLPPATRHKQLKRPNRDRSA